MTPSGHYPSMVQYNRWMTGKLCPVYAAFFGALRTERQPLDARIEAWAEHRDREWLAAPSHYTSGMAGKTLTLSTWVLVSHIFNHQADPHSQAITLIHQLGRDPGITHIPRMLMLNR